MPETLCIGSDINTAETKVLFDERDFFDLVEDKMGHDAAMYLHGLLRADQHALDDAYARGRIAGLEECDEGHEYVSYNNGHEDGYNEGHSTGYGEGYSEGYAKGFKEGYEKARILG